MSRETSLSVGEHFDLLAELLEVEREAEKQENQLRLERMPLSMREALGKTVTRLSVDGVETGVGGYARILLSRVPRGESLAPFHGMNQGDNVRLSLPAGEGPAFVDGTLDHVEGYRVSVAVDQRLPEPMPEGRYSVDLLGSDATYKRMRKALQQAARSREEDAARLRDILLAREGGRMNPLPELEFFNPTLNEWQREAVRRAMAVAEVALVHGPPGTGKTTVLVEVIRQAVARGWRVLATAPSNVAVDNILEKLLPEGKSEAELRVVRLGHPARTIESLRHGTLRAQVASDPEFVEIQEMEAWRQRLSKRLARSGSRALSGEERATAKSEIQRLWRTTRKLELSISRRLAAAAHVVISTHGGISSHILRGQFDLVVLDEASQATEPLSWIALNRGPRAVFAGDAQQLPPTLYSREAAERGLAVTLFERLKASLAEDQQTLLRVQYRMHEAIMGFSSRQFYEGKLIADKAVKRHRACELKGVKKNSLTERAVVFIDTAGTDFEEHFNEMLQSRENRKEAELAVTVTRELLGAGVGPNQLAILAPYTAQVKLLKTLISEQGLEIGTVDGFQGREKEATVLSLVRANPKGEVGFLSDTRRMNVAVTRARRLLIVIGDSTTISHHSFYRDFLDYVQECGDYRSAYEWQ